MTSLEHVLERSIVICATRSTVFRFFTDSSLFAEWWGQGSRIEGRRGGAVVIRYPNGVTASGTVEDIVEGERVVFTYGYDAPGNPILPGGSRVTVTLEDRPEGTLLKLRHELPDSVSRDHHVQGWRYQLALFANVAARDQHRDVAAVVDRYLGLWTGSDASAIQKQLAETTTGDVAFRDAFGCTWGREDLAAHVAAVQLHMPGVRLEREGEVRQCQGTAMANWVALGKGGEQRGRGTSVFDLAPDGRISRVVGFWGS